VLTAHAGEHDALHARAHPGTSRIRTGCLALTPAQAWDVIVALPGGRWRLQLVIVGIVGVDLLGTTGACAQIYLVRRIAPVPCQSFDIGLPTGLRVFLGQLPRPRHDALAVSACDWYDGRDGRNRAWVSHSANVDPVIIAPARPLSSEALTLGTDLATSLSWSRSRSSRSSPCARPRRPPAVLTRDV
jgi:hypothetical protein